MAKLQIGLVGFGTWTRDAYVPSLRTMDDVEVTAVAARSQETLDSARELLGPGPTLLTDYRELLAADAVDALMVAVPNHLHAEVIEAACDSGKPVLYEPPLGLDEPECQRVLAALERCSSVTHCDLELRCLPVVDRVCAALSSGEIGAVRMVTVRLRCAWGRGEVQIGTEVQRQGFFPWLGYWYLDLFDAVLGAAPTDAHVAAGRACNGDLLDHGVATLTFPGGRLGVFEINLIEPEGQRFALEAIGGDGAITADLQTGTWVLRRAGSAEELRYADPAAQPACGFVGMRESISDFVESIRHGRAARGNIQVVRRVHQAARLCHEADARALRGASTQATGRV